MTNTRSVDMYSVSRLLTPIVISFILILPLISYAQTKDTTSIIKSKLGDKKKFAILYIYNLDDYYDLASIYLGDSIICQIQDKKQFSIEIYKEGKIELWAKTKNKSKKTVTLDVKFGDEYFLKFDRFGYAFRKAKLSLVDKSVGQIEYKNLWAISDSSYYREIFEHKMDSLIIKKRYTDKTLDPQGRTHRARGTIKYTMNGEEITKEKVETRLIDFPSSARQYKISRRAKGVGLFFGVVFLADNITALFIQNNTPPSTFANTVAWIWLISGTGELTGLGVGSLHFNKAIRLYNEEILKRNK